MRIKQIASRLIKLLDQADQGRISHEEKARRIHKEMAYLTPEEFKQACGIVVEQKTKAAAYYFTKAEVAFAKAEALQLVQQVIQGAEQISGRKIIRSADQEVGPLLDTAFQILSKMKKRDENAASLLDDYHRAADLLFKASRFGRLQN
jgi:hypothetical protein